jgi:uncharacterized protein (DUF4415 family)
MAHKKRVVKSAKKLNRRTKSASGKRGKRKGLSLSASVEPSRGVLEDVLELYRPIKKPVTLRVDADVLVWFQRAGKRRYQTRMNAALRKVMEREMKAGE